MNIKVEDTLACIREGIEGYKERDEIEYKLSSVEAAYLKKEMIILNYQQLLEKLEIQLIKVQEALEGSTKREIEQLEIIGDLKELQLLQEQKKESENKEPNVEGEGEKDGEGKCDNCGNLFKENELLKQHN